MSDGEQSNACHTIRPEVWQKACNAELCIHDRDMHFYRTKARLVYYPLLTVLILALRCEPKSDISLTNVEPKISPLASKVTNYHSQTIKWYAWNMAQVVSKH